MIAHSQEPHKADKEETDEHDEANFYAQGVQRPVKQTACNTCHCVYLLAENKRHIVEQYIANDTACRPRYAAHDDGNPKGMPQSEGLLKSCDGEESQPKRIEHEPRIV